MPWPASGLCWVEWPCTSRGEDDLATRAFQVTAAVKRSLIIPFLVAALAGAVVWALAPMATGHAEPWDAGGLYYPAALLLAGLLAGFVIPGPLWMLYVGGVAGQFLYMILFLPAGPLIVVGVAFLLLWSLLLLGGAYAGSRLRRRMAVVVVDD